MEWKCEGEEALQEGLRSIVTDETRLLHLDYHPQNVLTDGERITGVVDWANTWAGDPRADAARTISILLVDPLARKPLLQGIGLRIFAWAWRAGYQREGGQLKEMAIFYAWAGTVIQNDLARRYKGRPEELWPARRWTDKWKARVGIAEG